MIRKHSSSCVWFPLFFPLSAGSQHVLDVTQRTCSLITSTLSTLLVPRWNSSLVADTVKKWNCKKKKYIYIFHILSGLISWWLNQCCLTCSLAVKCASVVVSGRVCVDEHWWTCMILGSWKQRVSKLGVGKRTKKC